MFGLNEALLSFIRRQVGLRTDGANANGSLHGRLKYITSYFAHKGVVASNTLRASADAERLGVLGMQEEVKSIRIDISGTVRVSFDIRVSQTGSGRKVQGQIHKNGEPFGVLRSATTATYTTFTEDIIVASGDYIQLRVDSAMDWTNYCRNFRIYYDYKTYDDIIIKN